MELARGARPELFIPQRRGGKKGTKIPLKAGSIDALKVFLPPGVDRTDDNSTQGQGQLQKDHEAQGAADQKS